MCGKNLLRICWIILGLWRPLARRQGDRIPYSHNTLKIEFAPFLKRFFSFHTLFLFPSWRRCRCEFNFRFTFLSEPPECNGDIVGDINDTQAFPTMR